ncbi:MAG: hypothetical protein EZS28_051654 [Streblomastix strix]|uniref:Uncharacterized protein n=1 Tax=Streblomastix strix TaxID=222440 RepID=A0A5J4T2U1_9EUKA|nr:MAG: hypothetical protein EZS28_051654 [Streblomastix strix]
MDLKCCEVYVDERNGEVTVRYSREFKAVVKKNGLFAPDTGELLRCSFFYFEDDEEFGPWQKLFDQISQEGANIIFPKLDVEPMLLEENTGYARRVLELSAAVVQGIAEFIHIMAQKNSENLLQI